MTSISRFCALPWPLFRKALSLANLPDGSFSESMTPDQRELILNGLVASLAIDDEELTASLMKLRTRVPTLELLWSTRATEIKSGEAAKAAGEPQRPDPWSGEAYSGGIRILHLSDLHLTGQSSVDLIGNQLILGVDEYCPKQKLDYVVVSGDFTDRGSLKGFDSALNFLQVISEKLNVPAKRFILVPGNHDVVDNLKAYSRVENPPATIGFSDCVSFVPPNGGSVHFQRKLPEYRKRFVSFSKRLYKPFLGYDYPLDEAKQGIVHSFPDDSIQFLTLNSAWEIDEFNRKRSSVHAQAINRLREQAIGESEGAQAVGVGERSLEAVFRIAVCHHSVLGPEQIRDTTFMDDLQILKTRILLHGDVHQLNRSDYLGYRPNRRIHVLGSGAFAAAKEDRPESTPRLCNYLEISKDRRFLRVHTLKKGNELGPWQPMKDWIKPGSDETTGVSYFAVALDPGY